MSHQALVRLILLSLYFHPEHSGIEGTSSSSILQNRTISNSGGLCWFPDPRLRSYFAFKFPPTCTTRRAASVIRNATCATFPGMSRSPANKGYGPSMLTCRSSTRWTWLFGGDVPWFSFLWQSTVHPFLQGLSLGWRAFVEIPYRTKIIPYINYSTIIIYHDRIRLYQLQGCLFFFSTTILFKHFDYKLFDEQPSFHGG